MLKLISFFISRVFSGYLGWRGVSDYNYRQRSKMGERKRG